MAATTAASMRDASPLGLALTTRTLACDMAFLRFCSALETFPPAVSPTSSAVFCAMVESLRRNSSVDTTATVFSPSARSTSRATVRPDSTPSTLWWTSSARPYFSLTPGSFPADDSAASPSEPEASRPTRKITALSAEAEAALAVTVESKDWASTDSEMCDGPEDTPPFLQRMAGAAEAQPIASATSPAIFIFVSFLSALGCWG
mmetsp:Transcript_19735/g.45221  ORF Transcript_19735/g.45221 Transcript_19735/m.45221 type:complete len:204 (-) Transcript_19735:16-627(-)